MILPLSLNSSSTAHTMKHISGLFSPCITSIFKNSPWLPETEPNSMDIKKETKNFRGGESVGNYRACRLRCVTYVSVLLCYGTVQVGIPCKFVWKNFRGLSEPVRKELLGQWVSRNKDKVSFVFAVFRWVFFLSEWTVSALSLSAIKLLGFCDQCRKCGPL